MQTFEFIRPIDATSFQQMEIIPGLVALVKKALIIGIENLTMVFNTWTSGFACINLRLKIVGDNNV